MSAAKPDFFIVGAPKCGTTAMNAYLRQHPEIFIPDAKELHHFGRDLVMNRPRDDRAQYLARFAGRGPQHKRAGEASVWYLWSRTCARELADFNPRARIVIMLRDPVEVMYSQHSQAIVNALGDEDILDFEQALAAEPDRAAGRRIPRHCTFADGLRYRAIVDFAPQVRRYFDVFGRDRVHVIIFDDFRADTAGAYRALLRFLGVDEHFVPELAVVNANQVVSSHRVRAVQRLIPPGWKDLVPDRARRRVSEAISRANITYKKRPPMDPALRGRLAAELTGQVEALSELLGRDLSSWSRV